LIEPAPFSIFNFLFSILGEAHDASMVLDSFVHRPGGFHFAGE
jgi:hypothetical protein